MNKKKKSNLSRHDYFQISESSAECQSVVGLHFLLNEITVCGILRREKKDTIK